MVLTRPAPACQDAPFRSEQRRSEWASVSSSKGWPALVPSCARQTRPFSGRAFREHRT